MESERSNLDMPPRRRDWDDDWHDLVQGSCKDCGCTISLAKDDPTIVWDPGPAWQETCSDRSCHCHVDPVIGARRP